MNCDSSWFDDRAILSYKKNIVLSANTYKFLFCARKQEKKIYIPTEHSSDEAEIPFPSASNKTKRASESDRLSEWVSEWDRVQYYFGLFFYFWTLNTVLCEAWKMSDLQERLRLVILGGPGVGKSCIVKRFLFKSYSDKYRATIEDLYNREYDFGNVTLKVNRLTIVHVKSA